MAGGQPVASLAGLGDEPALAEQLGSFACNRDRLCATTKSVHRFRDADQYTATFRPLRSIEQGAEPIRCGLPVAGRQTEFRVETRPARVRLGEQLARPGPASDVHKS